MTSVLTGLNVNEPPPAVVFTYGMGADSACLIRRLVLEPELRDFDTAEMAVVIAQTGNEWERTALDNEAAILPLLREHRIRVIQGARSQRYTTKQGNGVEVLSDTRTPTRILLEGNYTLEQEMLEAATLPQVGGPRRLCSIHAKGDVLDPIIAAITRGRPYRHIIGFEANETSRIANDSEYDTALRKGEFPLRDWGMTRADCEAYLLQHTGIRWRKSACYFCPYSLTNKANRARQLQDFAVNPVQGVDALFMEHVALALNPRQSMTAKDRLIDLVRAAGHHHLIAGLCERLTAAEHGLYEVRRIFRPKNDDPTAVANSVRSVRRLATGSRDQLMHTLTYGKHKDLVEIDDLHVRLPLKDRELGVPGVEWLVAIAPTVVLDKQDDNFEGWWAKALNASSRSR